MKAHPFLTAAVLCFPAVPTHADAINDIKINGVSFIMTAFNDWRSDQTPNSSTVRATMTDNPTEKRWEMVLWNLQTGSPNLTAGLDVTLGTLMHLRIQKYPNGDSLGRNPIYIYILGTGVQNFTYSDTTDLIELDVMPVAPATTASHNPPGTAVFGMYFPYSGKTGAPAITYSPPVIIGNLSMDDARAPQHPSSMLLWGKAYNVNGVNGQPVNINFTFGSTYAARWGFPLDDMKVYVDGVLPTAPDTSTGPSVPSYSINMGRAGETFKSLNAIIYKFSAHDIQAGVFRPRPQFTDVQRDPGGLRMNWNADTNRKYTIEYFTTLGGPTNILGTNLSGPSFLDPAGTASASRFYRLREE